MTDYVLSTAWVYTQEYPRAAVYNGGTPVTNSFVSLEINVIQGDFGATAKKQLLEESNATLAKYGSFPAGEDQRIYIVLREVIESNWGYSGQTIDLELLRKPVGNPKPL
jgi:phenylpyruvate tautomerase PptA (4-oxalocrotonate tautomerase family)